MNWDGHRSHCGASELSEVAPGGLWVILGWTGMNWNHTRAPVWATGMDWGGLGWTGMNWDGHRSGCGASENFEVVPGGLWVILGWTGMDWDELGRSGTTSGHQYGLLG